MIGLLQVFELQQASTMAKPIDVLYDFVFFISLVSFVGIVLAMLYFVIRYHRRRKHPEQTPYIEGHTPTELTMSAILFVLVMVIFAWGWIDYKKIRTSPADALEINLIGKQWLWEVEYANGRKLLNELVVPEGKPVKLIMSSADVIHSFYVPSFRLKQDVVPGTYTSLWFQATQAGEYPAYCAEYCGTAHSKMLAKVRVLGAQDYERWQLRWELEQQLGSMISTASATSKDGAALPPAEKGKELFSAKGCNACHSLTSDKSPVGPGLGNIFGKTIELTDGTKVTIDENYIRESIMDPNIKVVKGYQPLMPTYKGQLTDEDVNALVALIKSLKENP